MRPGGACRRCGKEGKVSKKVIKPEGELRLYFKIHFSQGVERSRARRKGRTSARIPEAELDPELSFSKDKYVINCSFSFGSSLKYFLFTHCSERRGRKFNPTLNFLPAQASQKSFQILHPPCPCKVPVKYFSSLCIANIAAGILCSHENAPG